MKAARPFRERAAARSHEPAVALDDFRSVAPLALAGVRIVPDEELAGEIADHVGEVGESLDSLRRQASILAGWARELARRLASGARLLVAGNGGSAAEAQHFAAELVGRYDDDRRPFSAIALHSDAASLTAIGDDYGYDEVFARQVRAHARHGDIVLLVSESGQSPNLVAAAQAAHELGARTWALTGPAPNPLAAMVDESVVLEGTYCHVEEAELVALHALCEGFESCVAVSRER